MTDSIENRHKYVLLKRRVRILLTLFVTGLVLSGATAFVITRGINFLERTFGDGSFMERLFPPMAHWISFVHKGVTAINEGGSGFIFYGTDWLAFGHIVIAVCFLGAIRDPLRNIWVVKFGMIACALIIPTAVICGHIRGIPWFWQIIDCSFGFFGFLPLWISHGYIKQMEQANK
jgi:hypothetical protein